ncbi:amidohydrolase [Sporomusa termitida]|uniref:Putative hydrolase YxeP n=1 Tax=Sporomusa termitida TaxID=2377 RepID=A0A517DZQ7_9FIRM|nr:amidohydrolase [Sporomusa termitida]QDR82845.1 putative hydrolase YxeP [Sporomusa termitida]
MDIKSKVIENYEVLHQLPELGFMEQRTAAFLASGLRQAGYQVADQIGGTGVIGRLHGPQAGPVVAVRADMDALAHTVEGRETAIHSCGHDANSAMVLTMAEAIAAKGLSKGVLKIIFQPAEETLQGARRLIEAGAIEDVDILIGIHLRPIEEARLGQATPALYHGASAIIEAEINGVAAHGARPHLGVNVIDAAAAVVHAVNAIHVNPVVPASVKVTKLHAGGPALNAIPDRAELALDLRAQHNQVMADLIAKAGGAVVTASAAVGATAVTRIKGLVPAAEYDTVLIHTAGEAITEILSPAGLLANINTPGGEDFHFYKQSKPILKTCYIGLGGDVMPGLHHPAMRFNTEALGYGTCILLKLIDKLLI